jgi:hypothetical protein
MKGYHNTRFEDPIPYGAGAVLTPLSVHSHHVKIVGKMHHDGVTSSDILFV